MRQRFKLTDQTRSPKRERGLATLSDIVAPSCFRSGPLTVLFCRFCVVATRGQVSMVISGVICV
jgi:hypothetical protein